MDKLYEFLVRFRTWLFNLALTVLIVAPDILNSPEVLAIIPADYQRWVLAGAFLVNIWMRPRPAVMAKDPEARK
jgi:hypothetical protein